MSRQAGEGLAARVTAHVPTVGELADVERTIKKLCAGRSYPGMVLISDASFDDAPW
jgi:hypothetical protein